MPSKHPCESDLVSRVTAFISRGQAEGGSDVAFSPLALDLFAYQFEKVPIYRRLCEKRGVQPGSIEHWSQIPALPISAFKEHEVSSIPESFRTGVFHSSGTTNQIPSRHFHSATSLAVYEASLLPWFEQNFPKEGLDLVFLTPSPDKAPHSSLIHMFKTVREANSQFLGQLEPEGSWSLDLGELDELSSGRPVGLLGTAFSFVHWLDHLAAHKRKLRLPPGSRIMETGGYKGRSRIVSKVELRRLMTKYLGVPEPNIVTEYGMCELGSQAYECQGIFHFPPWARTQIVSPETGRLAPEGETGLLRIFDLANIHSVMALQTEDLAVNRGDGFELLGRAESSEPRGCSIMATA